MWVGFLICARGFTQNETEVDLFHMCNLLSQFEISSAMILHLVLIIDLNNALEGHS